MIKDEFFDSFSPESPVGRGWGKLQWMQARRGDMRGIILNALREKPMHGYEVIKYLEETSKGMWRPSPGSVYPTLQMLEEADLVASTVESGKKVYSLTMAGEEAAKKTENEAPWKRSSFMAENRTEFRSVMAETFHAVKNIIRTNDPELNKQAMDVLTDTRMKLTTLAERAREKAAEKYESTAEQPAAGGPSKQSGEVHEA